MICRSHSRRGARDQPGQHLLSAASGLGRRSGVDAPDRRTASDHPFAGSRMLRDLLGGRREVGRLHVATLMKKMGIAAIYRRPNTSKPAPGHKIYPYLLRKLAVTRPNQVWAARHHLRADGAGLRLSCRHRRLVQPHGSWPGGCRSRWRPTSASRHWRKRWRGTASPRSSTPIREASSPGPTSPRC